MSRAVFSFIKPSPNSAVVSTHIAAWFAEQADAPLVCGKEIADVAVDTLFIMNGAFAFCDHLAELAKAIENSRRVVWLQNDYTIIPPKAESNAQSPFRKVFVDRARAGAEPLHFWTTVADNANATEHSRYINWNQFGWREGAAQHAHSGDVFYYGAFREGRKPAFDRYFGKACAVPITIDSVSPKFQQHYPHTLRRMESVDMGLLGTESVPAKGGIARDKFVRELGSHGLGLYLEDAASHKQFHSPASRFYEMIGARLPMVFQPEAVPMLKQAGFDVEPFVVHDASGFEEFMRRRFDVLTQQAEFWGCVDYRAALQAEVHKALEQL